MALTITLAYGLGLSKKGKRANNEDYISPLEGQFKHSDCLFLVCDGVGGANKGEVASRFVCEHLAQFFRNDTPSNKSFIEKAIAKVEKDVERHTAQNPETAGMATTLTLLHFHRNGATVAHIGDSRIYHIRAGKILYKSEDHSYVQDLIKSGLITHDEARKHPQRNVINRAIQGTHKPGKPDVFVLQDILAGDYFFLCSDGILESVGDDTLSELLNGTHTEQDILNEIVTSCEAGSRDNFSCYLVQVASCSGTPDTKTPSPPPYLYQHNIDPENSGTDDAHSSDGITVIRSAPAQTLESRTPEPEAERKTTVESLTPTGSIFSNFLVFIAFILIAGAVAWWFLKN